MRLNDSRWIAYWYLSIAAGFVLLGLYNALMGTRAWLVGIRFVIAAGFGALGWMELQTKPRRKK